MRALSACLTAILALGLGAAACSSSSSDDSAAAGSAGAGGSGTTAGGTGGAAGAADECPNLPQACADCVATNCADAVSACEDDPAAMCPTAEGTFDICACQGDMTLTQCTATFSASGDLAKAVADCSMSMCATPCNL
jgi:hypothetical protein